MKGVSITATVKGVGSHKKVTSSEGLVQFSLNVGSPSGDLEVLV